MRGWNTPLFLNIEQNVYTPLLTFPARQFHETKGNERFQRGNKELIKLQVQMKIKDQHNRKQIARGEDTCPEKVYREKTKFSWEKQ